MAEMKSTREAFGEVLVELGLENEDIFVVDCDISKSTMTTKFKEFFPDREINVGIAEQNAACIAAGLATCGKIPFISTYAVFASMRMCEQIRTSICYPNLNVKIAVSHGGLTPGNDGPTHQAIEDMGIMRTIPNMTVIMPADYVSTKKLMRQVASMKGPVYIRFTRDPVLSYYNENDEFQIGKAKIIKEGKDISIIVIGDLLSEALLAVDELEKKGVSVELIDMHTIKPIDEEAIYKTSKKTGRVITVEDHNFINGLGSAVADVMAKHGTGLLRKVGLQDTFAESAKYNQLLSKYKLDKKYIIEQAEELLNIK